MSLAVPPMTKNINSIDRSSSSLFAKFYPENNLLLVQIGDSFEVHECEKSKQETSKVFFLIICQNYVTK